MLVSIIVPAYKQEKTIKEDIRNIYNVMAQTRWDFEIIVVVDGFVDNTFDEAKKIDLDVVTIVGYKTNKGKGYALRYGMARAVGEYVAFIDSGMEIDPNGISMILEHMQWYKADIIVASKRHPASKVNMPLIRKIYSWGYHTLVKILFRFKVSDTQTGLKVFKREVLEKILPRLLIKEYALDVELLAVSRYLGFKRIFEAPVELHLDLSSGSRFKGFLIFDPFIRKMLTDTLAIFYRMYILSYYSNNSRRKWIYDPELEMQINTGELNNG